MQTDTGSASLKLLVLGFNENERRLLQSIVKLSQRRTPTLHLLETSQGESADVVLIDGQDEAAVNWANTQPWLNDKPVGWVDPAADIPPRHTALKRPVQWPILPMLLSRIIFKGKGGEGAAQPAPQPRPTPQPTPTPQPRPTPQATPQPQPTPQPTPQLRPTPAPGPAPTPGPAPAAQSGKRVLVVDDSLAVRQQLQAFLEKRGFAADFAESGDAALTACQGVNYDCVMLDVLMPGMDGYEACRRIKALPNMLKRVKVIMLTSRTSPFDRIRGKMAGCDAYLTKPVQAQKLYETLNQFLS